MIPEFIQQRMNRGLLYTKDNPIGIVKNRLCQNLPHFKLMEKLDPIVDKEDNFDLLKYASYYLNRNPKKTYYTNESSLLRTSMAAHLSLVHYQYTEMGIKNIALCGEVFNNVPTDPKKYPITHQLSLFSIVDHKADAFPKIAQAEMKKTIRMLMNDLLANDDELTYSFYADNYPYDFPYLTDFHTLYLSVDRHDPLKRFSTALNIAIGQGGRLKPDVMESIGSSLSTKRAWLFNINLDRLAMQLFGIDDIRLLWSCDSRFTDQFKAGVFKKFKSFSNHELHNMFLPLEIKVGISVEYIEEQVCSIVREACGDMAEEVYRTNTHSIWVGSSRREYFNVRFRCIHKELSKEELEYMKSNIKAGVEKAGFTILEKVM